MSAFLRRPGEVIRCGVHDVGDDERCWSAADCGRQRRVLRRFPPPLMGPDGPANSRGRPPADDPLGCRGSTRGSTSTREGALDSWGCSALPTLDGPMLRPMVVRCRLVEFPLAMTRLILVTQVLDPGAAVGGSIAARP